MKQTVFRKVYVKDRLPVSFGSYITNLGDCFYHNGSKQFESVSGFAKPEWFLEEIELPSEKELEEKLHKEAWARDMGLSENNSYQSGYLDGANCILNKMK